MPKVLKSEAEILNSLKLSKDSQGNGQFATDSQGLKRMSDGNPRTGTFHQITVGDTACNVKICINISSRNLPYVKMIIVNLLKLKN